MSGQGTDAGSAAMDRLLVQCQLEQLGIVADDVDTTALGEAYRLVATQVATLYSAAAGKLLS